MASQISSNNYDSICLGINEAILNYISRVAKYDIKSITKPNIFKRNFQKIFNRSKERIRIEKIHRFVEIIDEVNMNLCNGEFQKVCIQIFYKNFNTIPTKDTMACIIALIKYNLDQYKQNILNQV